MSLPTIMIAAAVLLALVIGLRGGRGHGHALEEWSVAGRRFGTLLVFLLMAGETYTTFTFLGASGYAYGKGAASYYIIAYITLAYVLSYWLLPPIWRYAREHSIVSQAGFFARKYDSVPLGVLVTLVGVVALIPYLVLQLKGLAIIMTTASYGAISPNLGVWLGALVIAAFVAVSGIHGPAALALIKDVLIIAVVVVLGLYLPWRIAGGVGPMFAAIEKAHPGFLAFPARGQSVAWFDSTVASTALGFFLWPHLFSAVFTARDERSIRRNTIIAPLYGLMLLFALFVGFAALLRVPGLTGKSIDLALFKVALAELPPVAVGVIGVAGVLTALVPGAMILTTASTTIARDLYPLARRRVDDRQVATAAKVAVPILALVAIWFAIHGGDTIVALLLMGYALVTQLAPALLASLAERQVLSATGAMAGILVGVAVVGLLSLTKTTLAALAPWLPGWIADLNLGMVALAFNIATVAVVSLLEGVAARSTATKAAAHRP